LIKKIFILKIKFRLFILEFQQDAFIEEIVKKLLMESILTSLMENIHKSKAEKTRERTLCDQFDHTKVGHQEGCHIEVYKC
jgi:hypothetical protein